MNQFIFGVKEIVTFRAREHDTDFGLMLLFAVKVITFRLIVTICDVTFISFFLVVVLFLFVCCGFAGTHLHKTDIFRAPIPLRKTFSAPSPSHTL